MAGAVFCCCYLFIFPLFGFFVWMTVKFFYSIISAETYTEAFSDFFPYFFSWIVYFFHLFFVGLTNVLPYILLFGLCQLFWGFIANKVLELKKLKIELMLEKVSPKLEYYIGKMKIMRQTLLMVFGFLLGLRFLTWFFFHNSFVMEIFAYANVGMLMAFLMIENSKEANEEQKTVLYNFVMIFISSLIIDDTFQMLTGYRFLFL